MTAPQRLMAEDALRQGLPESRIRRRQGSGDGLKIMADFKPDLVIPSRSECIRALKETQSGAGSGGAALARLEQDTVTPVRNSTLQGAPERSPHNLCPGSDPAIGAANAIGPNARSNRIASKTHTPAASPIIHGAAACCRSSMGCHPPALQVSGPMTRTAQPFETYVRYSGR